MERGFQNKGGYYNDEMRFFENFMENDFSW